MTDLFSDRFRDLVPRYFEDEWVEEDGLSVDELDEMLRGKEFGLPLALWEFYRAVGATEDVMEAFHFFWDPDELEVEDGYLLFLEDEDEQFTWGMRVDQLSVPDPIVWRRNNARGQWQSEEGTFSEYVLDLFAWIFEEDEEQD